MIHLFQKIKLCHLFLLFLHRQFLQIMNLLHQNHLPQQYLHLQQISLNKATLLSLPLLKHLQLHHPLHLPLLLQLDQLPMFLLQPQCRQQNLVYTNLHNTTCPTNNEFISEIVAEVVETVLHTCDAPTKDVQPDISIISIDDSIVTDIFGDPHDNDGNPTTDIQPSLN